MNDYGEPLFVSNYLDTDEPGVVTQDNTIIVNLQAPYRRPWLERMVASTNALAGLDPAAVVELLEAAKKWNAADMGTDDGRQRWYDGYIAMSAAAIKLWPEKEAAHASPKPQDG